MTSPYVEEAAKRAALIGSKWDHDNSQLRYARQSALYEPLERSKPIRPTWQDWAAGFILLATIAGVIVYSLVV